MKVLSGILPLPYIAPWQGGFYERLIGMVKQSLRKGMGRKVLYWDKLTTLLVEVEASHPLTYVGEDFESGFVLTPTHFLTGNRDVIPCYIDYSSDVDYFPKMDSVKELSEHRKRSQKQSNQFWESWKHEYLLGLRETLPLVHRNKQMQLKRQPRVGEIVIVKDEHTPRRAWRLAKIREFIYSKDGKIRSAKICLLIKTLLLEQ